MYNWIHKKDLEHKIFAVRVYAAVKQVIIVNRDGVEHMERSVPRTWVNKSEHARSVNDVAATLTGSVSHDTHISL